MLWILNKIMYIDVEKKRFLHLSCFLKLTRSAAELSVQSINARKRTELSDVSIFNDVD